MSGWVSFWSGAFNFWFADTSACALSSLSGLLCLRSVLMCRFAGLLVACCFAIVVFWVYISLVMWSVYWYDV